MLYKRDGSEFWWIRFKFRGKLIQQSSKSTNKRVAQQIEAALKTEHAKGAVGIATPKAAPTLAEFIDNDFLPHVQNTSQKANTRRFYAYHAEVLQSEPEP